MEQQDNKESFHHLDLVCRYVAGNFGNPEIGSWTNGDYIRLSGILSRETDIHLSPSTLKRIFGKLKTNERYYPQKATRDGLARYAGFGGWDEFVEKHPRTAKLVEGYKTPIPTPPSKLPHPRAPKISWWPAMVLMAGACAIFGWQWFSSVREQAAAPPAALLVCSNPVGGNPHSAVFRLQLPENFRGDSSRFFMFFGDEKRGLPIRPGAVQTHYYDRPGRFYATLQYQDHPIDTLPIYLTTDGWTSTAYALNDTTRVYPLDAPVFGPGGMTTSARAVFATGVDTLHTFHVDYTNMREFDVSGDNMDFTATVTTSSQRAGVRCSQVMITLYGEKTKHELLLLKPGCVSWSHLRFSEKLIDGEKEDLSPVGSDLTAGGAVHVKVAGKRASITVNGKPLYTVAYNHPVGKLYGVRIAFAGIGAVHRVTLKRLDGSVVFDEGKPGITYLRHTARKSR